MDENETQDTQDQDPVLPPAAQDSLEAESRPAGDVEPAEADAAEVPPVVEPVPGAEVEDPAADALAALAQFEQPAAQPQVQQQPGGLDPRVFAQAVREAVDSSPQARLVAEALQRQQQMAATPRPPQEPGPDGTVADWQRYTAQVTDYAVRSAVAPLANQMQQLQQAFGGQLQQLQQTFQRQQQVAQQQAYASTLNNAIDGLSKRPSYAWLNEDPLRAEMVKLAYERGRGHGISLEQAAESIGRSFGMLPAPPQQRAQQTREASTAALAAKRARPAAVRPAAGGKAPPARMTNEERMKKNGLWDALPDDMKQLHRMRDRRAMN